MQSQLCSWRFLGAILVAWSLGITARGEERQLEITWDGQTRTGAVVAHNTTQGWFMERDGRLTVLDLNDVSNYKVQGYFRPHSIVETRDRLAREFGNEFRVATRGKYVVVAGGAAAERYATLFDELYREFVVMFGARGFKLSAPQYPLVAVVYPDESAFLAYCRTEDVQPQPGLRGFYLPASNRVVMYDSAAAGQGSIAAMDRTILHEAVHQVAFNTGVHSRLGENPLWVVEGLATTLEVGSVRSGDRLSPPGSRVNVERLRWYLKTQNVRSAQTWTDLIARDDRFRTHTLDAYSEAWALTFYLLESRSADYTSYLRRMATRDPTLPLTAEQRLEEFQQVFGKDIAMLDARLRRFYDELSTQANLIPFR